MKKKVLLAVIPLTLICAALVIFFINKNTRENDIQTVIAHANLKTYSNEQEMYNDSDLIVLGTVETTL